jgi:hypothetical protein
MTIFEHALWPAILPVLYLRRGKLGVNGPRQRIEVRKAGRPPGLAAVTIACAYCGRGMFPFRPNEWGHLTFNVSCPLAVSVKCARMPASKAMAARVRAAMAEWADAHDDPRSAAETIGRLFT